MCEFIHPYINNARIPYRRVYTVWSPSCSYQGNNCGYGEVDAQYAIQYKLLGTALLGQKTNDFLQ